MDGSTWELAGINYAVDGPYSLTPGGSSFIAAMYNQTGLYDRVSGDPLTRARADHDDRRRVAAAAGRRKHAAHSAQEANGVNR